MPLKPSQLLTWARALAESPADPTDTSDDNPDEIIQRDAVKHAYYAVFLLADEWAKSRGFKYPKNSGGMHKCLWERWYGNDPATKAIARRGKALHDKRIHADYRIGEVLFHKPSDVCDEAEELFLLIMDDKERVLNQQAEPLKRVIGVAPPKRRRKQIKH